MLLDMVTARMNYKKLLPSTFKTSELLGNSFVVRTVSEQKEIL